MTVRYYSSVAPETTLSNTINNSATSITVGSTVGFPPLTPYTLALDYEGATEELVQVNSAAGTTLSVTRAIDGTSAAAHNAGARVRHVTSARDFSDSRTHENSDQGIHGLSPTEEIVGTDKVQTLTNKTLSSPAFTGSFTGTLNGDASAGYRSDNVNPVSLASTNHPFQLGPDAGSNLRMDVNDIQSANNGSAAGLAIQREGGVTSFSLNLAADNTGSSVQVNGQVDANVYNASRTATTSNVTMYKADSDTQFRYVVRADGRTSWGPGGVTAPDSSLYRTGINTLEVSGNLNALLSLSADSAFFNTLTVSGQSTFAKTVSTGTSLATVQAGWSLSSAQYVATAGVATVQITVTRTGGTITAGSDGNIIPDSPLVQLNSFALPNSNLSDLHFAASSTKGTGAAYMSSGMIILQTWIPGQSIINGDNISVYLTYVQ